MSTSGATDGDVVHVIITAANTSVLSLFADSSGGDGNILSTGPGGKSLTIPGVADTLGGSFTLIYVNSASKWAVVGLNGLVTF